MKRKLLFISLCMILLTGLTACNQDESAEETETETEEESGEQANDVLDEEQAKQTIKDFREVFMKVINNIENDGEVKNYQSKEEVKEEFTKYMSDQQADTFLESYFEERNEKLYVIATEAPFWIEEEKDFKLEHITEEQYKITQEIKNELAGHQRVTYLIQLRDDEWMVDDLTAEPIQKEDPASQGSQTDSNADESNAGANAGDKTDASNEESSTDTGAGQSSDANDQATEEGPEDVSKEEPNGEITAGKAEELVREHLGIPEDSNLHVVMDHLDNDGNYVVQVYEVVSDGEVGHTATIGWYIVNKNNGSIEQMM